MDDEKLAMQVRCVHCLREQYAPNVIGVSTGENGCSWCGQRSERMTRRQYVQALDARRAQDRR